MAPCATTHKGSSLTSASVVSREISRTRRTPVVSRETTGVFTARRVGATRFRWAMSSHNRSSAATTPPQRQQRTQQPASPASRPAHETVFTLKGRHQRGRSPARHHPPTAHSTTGQSRLAAWARRSVHLRRAPPPTRDNPPPKRLTSKDAHQQAHSATAPVNCRQWTAPGTAPASPPGPGRARRGGGRIPRRGRRNR